MPPKTQQIDHIQFAVVLTLLMIFMTTLVCCPSGNAAEGNEIIRSGAEVDYPPFSFVDDDGIASGFSVELMRAALSAMGREVTFRTGAWNDVRGWLERAEIDALPLVGRTPEREALFDFTVPYMTLHGAIVVRENETGIMTLSDLHQKEVAVMKGDNAEEFLRRETRDLKIRTEPTFEVALQELSKGRYDAVVIQRLVALRLIQKTGLTDLKVIDQPVEGFQQDFCFAVHEGDRKTLALLNEGLAVVMADGTHRHLHAKWFAAMELPTDRPLVIGGDRNFPPFEFLDEKGRPAGFNVDLTRALAREMGLDVDIRLGRWTERMDALKQKKIDAVQGMFYSTHRDLHFDFTQAHTLNHGVAVVRRGEGTPPEDIEALKKREIVVEKGDILHEYLLEKGLKGQVFAVEDQEQALQELSEGKHACALVSRNTALYLMEKRGWHHLVPAKKPILVSEYCYAVAGGEKALLAQFNEGMKVLEKNGEYRRIHDKWLGIYHQKTLSFIILRYAALVITPLIVIFFVFVAWSWMLRRQVREKTQALAESLDRFRCLFEAANVGKSITLPTGELNVNQAFADFIGYEINELKGKRWQEITPEEDIDATEKVIASLLAGEKNSARFEKRYRHKNGKTLWADVSVALRRDADGTPLYFMTTVVDINARKRAESALKASEAFQRAMIACSPVALYTVDLHGKVLTWNRSAERIFGWCEDEVMGKPLPIVPPEHQGEFDTLRQQVLELGGFSKKELIRLKKGGALLPISLSVAPVRNDMGEIIGILGAAEDLTDQKRRESESQKLQTQLIQAQKMESVGRLAGGVAHDFNNMLSVIIGFGEMALEKTESDESLREDLDEILEAARRSADITRQLLAFARKQTIDPKVIDLNGTVEGMLKMLRRLIGEDIDLFWQPAPHPMPVFMDPSQLDQLLANLCVNARDAIAGVGKLTIETERTRFDAQYCADHAGFIPGNYILLAVSDDGCGMDSETRKNIFEPFFTTKGLGKGTGLGLSTVFGIVKQNKGFINVYSEPGKGTTFRIYLPAYETENGTIEREKSDEIPVGHGETVLVVEDEASILNLTQKTLDRLGYVVLAAATPAEAVTLATASPQGIELLITDVVMPEMNGRQLAEQIQSIYPEIKVLFMSGYTANVIAHHGVLDGDVNFIQKPFSIQSLAMAVHEALVS